MAAQVGAAEVRYGRPETRADVAHPQPIDLSNPYFAFDASSCIVCSRCVRACADIQGTFALTVEGRGFDSKISAGGTDFLSSECVSCGACVQACPTSALQENSVVAARHADPLGRDHLRLLRRRLLVPRRGPGRGRRLPRRADDPVQGRRRQRGPQLRQGPVRLRLRRPQGPPALADGARHASTTSGARSRGRRRSPRSPTGFKALQAEHGVGAIGGISSSRCTNEEVYVVQKMVRAAFGNNNIDTCARVCHSPTGYGLKQTFGTSAGTQDFRSVDAGRRDPADRRQPHRRPPGLRLADEAAAARGRAADRGRPAPHRPGAQPARRGGPPPAGAARLQRRLRQRDGPRDRHRGPPRRGVRARALRGRRRLPRLHRRPVELARGDRPRRPASTPTSCARPPGCTPPAATPRSTTASASPSTPRARRW